MRLDEVVLRTLEQKPERRYQHASDVKTEVETIAGVLEKLPPHLRYAMGYEYKSKTKLFGLPLVHVAHGVDPSTGKTRVARGIVAIGARARGIPEGVVLADAGYGMDTNFRSELTKLGMVYVVGIQNNTTVWKPGEQPQSAPARKGNTGRPRKLLQRDAQHQPIAVKQLALSLPATAWRKVIWRQGVKQKLQSRFAALRVRPAHRDYWRSEPHPEEWLLIEWPTEGSEPTKYWLSTTSADIALAQLVHLAKHRWIIERDYQELKQELGLGHYEGRGWRGFHHHATLCIAAYGFLVAERSRFSPSAQVGNLGLPTPEPPAFLTGLNY